MADKVISIRMNAEVYKSLKVYAAQHDMTIRQALENAIKEYTKK